MNEVAFAQITHDCMLVIIKLGGPILISAMIVGLVVSFVQAITQVNEATLAFLPKLAAIGATLLLLGPYMVRTLADFSQHMFDRIVIIGGS